MAAGSAGGGEQRKREAHSGARRRPGCGSRSIPQQNFEALPAGHRRQSLADPLHRKLVGDEIGGPQLALADPVAERLHGRALAAARGPLVNEQIEVVGPRCLWMVMLGSAITP